MKLHRAKVLLIVPLFAALALAQSAPPAVIKPGDNLVAEGIPPIPAAIAKQGGSYTEVRGGYFSFLLLTSDF